MRIIIIANGWLNNTVDLQPGELLIAADGGGKHCLKLGLKPDYVVGDLDSLDDQAVENLVAQGANIVRYPARKDFTDLELAIQHAVELGATQIVIHAALGARWDQTIANLLLPAAFPKVHIQLADGNQEIHLLRGGQSLEIHGQPGDTISLIPFSAQAAGVITENLEYPLADETLYLGSTRGVSNVLLAEQARVSLREGAMLCTVIKHKNKETE